MAIEQTSPEAAHLEKIFDALSRRKYDLSCEATVQRQIEEALFAGGVSHKRERWLSDRDRVDFLCEGGIALEVKLRPRQAREIHRQLLRYCQDDAVRTVVLVTARTIGLPHELNGRPC